MRSLGGRRPDACVWSQTHASGVSLDSFQTRLWAFPCKGLQPSHRSRTRSLRGGLVQPRPGLLYVTLYVTRGPALV